MEFWKDVEGFEEYFMISSYGRIYRKKRNKIDQGSLGTRGYRVIDLRYYGGQSPTIHSLVMWNFRKEKYFAGAEIDHIDGDKENNHIHNLEWVTHEENLRRWAYKREKNFVAVSPEGEETEYQVQSIFCEKYPELDFRHVSACLNGSLPQHKGWKFYYIDPSIRKTYKHTEKGKPFKAIDPEGNEYEGRNQVKFAKEHGLKSQMISLVLTGKYKAYKGWHFEYL